MQPLSTLQRIMCRMCICAPVPHKAIAVIMVILFVCAITSYSVYIWAFISIDLNQSLFTISTELILCEILYCLIIGNRLQNEMRDIFGKLADIYDFCMYNLEFACAIRFSVFVISFQFSDKNTDLFPYLERTNNKCESKCNIYLKCVIGCLINFIMLAIFSVLFCYLNHNRFDTERVYHPTGFS